MATGSNLLEFYEEEKFNKGQFFHKLLAKAQNKNKEIFKKHGIDLLIEFTKEHLDSWHYSVSKKPLLLNFMIEKIKEADDCKIDYEHVVAFSTILLDLWNPFHFLNNKKRKIHFERKKEIEEILCKLGSGDAVAQLRKLLYWGYVKNSFVLLSIIIYILSVPLLSVFVIYLIYKIYTDPTWRTRNDDYPIAKKRARRRVH